MQENKHITILTLGRATELNVDNILYVLMDDKIAEIHNLDGSILLTRMKLGEMEEALGEGFIKIHRGCLVAAKCIHAVKDKVELSNGERLPYTSRKKRQITEQLRSQQIAIIRGFDTDNTPQTTKEYRNYYRCFDALPVAFTDIELVFNEKKRAVDWIFRYANPALAELEKLPLKKLLGRSFGSLFANMDPKWLRAYERATLYGETMEIMDYSPEIDTHLKIICFPTFPGHCGCILFDITEIKFSQNNSNAQAAWMCYLNNL